METRVALRDGRSVSVRTVQSDDAPLLEEFYERLSFASRRLRFFSGWHVGREAAERFADVEDTGGFALVAVAVEDAEDRIVGDVRWTQTSEVASGVPEMAIAVRDDYQRTGLGRLLLALLAREARARGIGSFSASLLTANAGMRRLLETGGFAIVDHDGAHSVEVVMGTDGGMPEWPTRDHREGARVLVEGPGWWGREDQLLLRQAGYDVVQCLGPRVETACPLLMGRSCPLVEAADMVVIAVPAAGCGDELRDAHEARGTTVVVNPTELARARDQAVPANSRKASSALGP